MHSGGGIILSLFCDRHLRYKNEKINIKLQLWALAGVVFWVWCFFRHPEWLSVGFSYLLVFMLYPGLIILFQSDTAEKLFRHRWIGELGKITFDVYVWHAVLLTFLRILTENTQYEGYFASRKVMYITAIFIFLLGTLSYYFIDKPITKKLKIYFDIT